VEKRVVNGNYRVNQGLVKRLVLFIHVGSNVAGAGQHPAW
jgi:hypothetical protein